MLLLTVSHTQIRRMMITYSAEANEQITKSNRTMKVSSFFNICMCDRDHDNVNGDHVNGDHVNDNNDIPIQS